jgi:hypothetical protein
MRNNNDNCIIIIIIIINNIIKHIMIYKGSYKKVEIILRVNTHIILNEERKTI